MPRRVRLDQLLVQRSLAPSRERAQALILAGVVRVDGDPVRRSADSVAEDASISLDAGRRFVSRGGDKLDAALAVRVYAVDVGKGQLDWKLRNDPRVVVMEGVNAREGVSLPEPVDLIVADVSFISLRIAIAPSLAHLRPSGEVVALVKPQFEAGRDAVGRGGIVRDPAARAASVVAVAQRLAAEGVPVVAVVPSRLPGREGNREIFVHARCDSTALSPDALRLAADEAAR